jgi:hypothetical protein
VITNPLDGAANQVREKGCVIFLEVSDEEFLPGFTLTVRFILLVARRALLNPF